MATKKKTKDNDWPDDEAPEARSGETPEQQEAPVDPYADFADPVTDGSKPIIDHISPGNSVLALVFDGSNVLTLPPEVVEDQDHLVFVQTGASQEWLTGESAKRKFVQDKDGQIFYYAHGVSPTDDLKVVDVVALGT